ncbi:ADP-ribosyltransferase [Nocardia sp. GCM10030253]|uniref:ADP-ribosyltransferase n=1 Tax=Nocardia sp. GCM10030253 TaxID=3273404 RepID=UPI00363C3EE4
MSAASDAWKEVCDSLSGKIEKASEAASKMSRTAGSSHAEQAAHTFGAKDEEIKEVIDATGKKDRELSAAQSRPEPKTFATGRLAHTYGTRVWGETVERLDPDEIRLLRTYTESDYSMINGMLRGQLPSMPSVQERVFALDEILRKKPVPEWVQVTKAIQPSRLFPGRNIADITPGYTGKLPDFVSTAMHRDGIEVIQNLDSRNVTATFDVPPGTPGIYLGGISSRPEELELLLGRDLDYQLTQPIRRIDSAWSPRWAANIRIIPPS